MRLSQSLAGRSKAITVPAILLLSAATLATGSNASAAERSSSAEAKGVTPPKRSTVLCPVDDSWVPESTRGVLGSMWLSYGQSATVTPDTNAKIWAGVWFTGSNGPAGWTDSPAGGDYPLPGLPVYSLIGRIGNGPWQYIGNRPLTFSNTKPGYLQKVVLRTNDNVPGNGSDAFHAWTAYPCTGG